MTKSDLRLSSGFLPLTPTSRHVQCKPAALHLNLQAYFPAMKKLSSTDLEMSRFAPKDKELQSSYFLPRSIKEHSVRIMAVIKLYVDNIHHLDRIEPNIEALGN